MKTGDLIRQVRLNKKISQSELARKLNVKQQYISQIERNVKKISSEKLIEFGKALEVCPKVFVTCDKCNHICSLCDLIWSICIYKKCLDKKL